MPTLRERERGETNTRVLREEREIRLLVAWRREQQTDLGCPRGVIRPPSRATQVRMPPRTLR
jgi:hypothetical protein